MSLACCARTSAPPSPLTHAGHGRVVMIATGAVSLRSRRRRAVWLAVVPVQTQWHASWAPERLLLHSVTAHTGIMQYGAVGSVPRDGGCAPAVWGPLGGAMHGRDTTPCQATSLRFGALRRRERALLQAGSLPVREQGPCSSYAVGVLTGRLRECSGGPSGHLQNRLDTQNTTSGTPGHPCRPPHHRTSGLFMHTGQALSQEGWCFLT